MLSDIEGMGPGWCMGEALLVARRGFRCGGVAYGCTMRVSEGHTDKPLTKAYDFSLPVRSDLTLYAKRATKSQSYAILYKDGLLSLQAGPDTDPSRGEVLGKWAWDGSSVPGTTPRASSTTVCPRVSRARLAGRNLQCRQPWWMTHPRKMLVSWFLRSLPPPSNPSVLPAPSKPLAMSLFL